MKSELIWEGNDFKQSLTLITDAVNSAKSLEFLPWLLLVLEDYFSANHQARIEQIFGYFDSNEVFDLVYDIIDIHLQLESNLENSHKMILERTNHRTMSLHKI